MSAAETEFKGKKQNLSWKILTWVTGSVQYSTVRLKGDTSSAAAKQYDTPN